MNKAKFSTTLLLLGALLLLPLFAAAAPSITEPSVSLTADYSKFADEDDDFILVTTETFTVVNDGMEPIDIKVKVMGLPNNYKVQPEVKDITVPAATDEGDGSAEVTLTIEVPHDKSPGTEKIGTVIITDSNGNQLANSNSADLIQKTVSMLDLTELEVKYVDSNGKTQKDEFNTDDDTYKLDTEVKPYTEMTFTFDLKNLFHRDYQKDGTLEEVELTVDVDDTDLLENGFEDRYSFDDLEAGKSGKHSITLLINQDVEPDNYVLEFTITAEDGEGIEYEIKKEVELEVELDDDDVRIVKAALMPETATICDKVTLDVEVHNFGSDDQDSVRLTLINTELGLNEKAENIAIDAHNDNDDSWLKTFTIDVKDAKAKTYFLDLKSYLGNTITDADAIQLDLKPCTQELPVEEEEEEPVLAGPENESAEKPTTGKDSVTGNVIKSVEKISYNSNDYLIALMLIAIAAVAGLIVLMLVVLFKSK